MKFDYKRTGFRMWKSGKQWLFAGAALVATVATSGVVSADETATTPAEGVTPKSEEVSESTTTEYSEAVTEELAVEPVVAEPTTYETATSMENLQDKPSAEFEALKAQEGEAVGSLDQEQTSAVKEEAIDKAKEAGVTVNEGELKSVDTLKEATEDLANQTTRVEEATATAIEVDAKEKENIAKANAAGVDIVVSPTKPTVTYTDDNKSALADVAEQAGRTDVAVQAQGQIDSTYNAAKEVAEQAGVVIKMDLPDGKDYLDAKRALEDLTDQIAKLEAATEAQREIDSSLALALAEARKAGVRINVTEGTPTQNIKSALETARNIVSTLATLSGAKVAGDARIENATTLANGAGVKVVEGADKAVSTAEEVDSVSKEVATRLENAAKAATEVSKNLTSARDRATNSGVVLDEKAPITTSNLKEASDSATATLAGVDEAIKAKTKAEKVISDAVSSATNITATAGGVLDVTAKDALAKAQAEAQKIKDAISASTTATTNWQNATALAKTAETAANKLVTDAIAGAKDTKVTNSGVVKTVTTETAVSEAQKVASEINRIDTENKQALANHAKGTSDTNAANLKLTSDVASANAEIASVAGAGSTPSGTVIEATAAELEAKKAEILTRVRQAVASNTQAANNDSELARKVKEVNDRADQAGANIQGTVTVTETNFEAEKAKVLALITAYEQGTATEDEVTRAVTDYNRQIDAKVAELRAANPTATFNKSATDVNVKTSTEAKTTFDRIMSGLNNPDVASSTSYDVDMTAIREFNEYKDSLPTTLPNDPARNGFTPSGSATHLNAGVLYNFSAASSGDFKNPVIRLVDNLGSAIPKDTIITSIEWGNIPLELAVGGQENAPMVLAANGNGGRGGGGYNSIWDDGYPYNAGGTMTRIYEIIADGKTWYKVQGAATTADGAKHDLYLMVHKDPSGLSPVYQNDQVAIWNDSGAINLLDGGSVGMSRKPGDGIRLVLSLDRPNNDKNYHWFAVYNDIDGGQYYQGDSTTTRVLAVGGGMSTNSTNASNIASNEDLGFNYGINHGEGALHGHESLPDGSAILWTYGGMYNTIVRNTWDGNGSGVARADFGTGNRVTIDTPVVTRNESTSSTYNYSHLRFRPGARPLNVPLLSTVPTAPKPVSYDTLRAVPATAPTDPTLKEYAAPTFKVAEIPTPADVAVTYNTLRVHADYTPVTVQAERNNLSVTTNVVSPNTEVVTHKPGMQVNLHDIRIATNVNPVEVTQKPGNLKGVFNEDGVNIDGKTIPKGSRIYFELSNEPLKAGRPVTDSYGLVDLTPAGFVVDLEATLKDSPGFVLSKPGSKAFVELGRSALEDLNLNLDQNVKVPTARIWGTVVNDMADYENVFTTIVNGGTTGNIFVEYKEVGTNAEISPTRVDSEEVPVGSHYDTTDLRPERLVHNGKVYVRVTERVDGNETGTVEDNDKRITYWYKVAPIGGVVVDYRDEVTGEIISPRRNDVTDVEVGTSYDTTDLKTPRLVGENGKTYELVPDNVDGIEKGKTPEGTTVVTYFYREVTPKGDVVVNYRDEQGNVIKDPVFDTTGGKVGDTYSTTDHKPEKITTPDGKEYTLVPNKTEGPETGKVTDKTTVVTYVYKLTSNPAKGTVVVNYRDEEGNVIKNPVFDTENAPVGENYTTTDNRPDKITTEDGIEYVRVPSKTEGNENGLVQPGVSTVTYVYKRVTPKREPGKGYQITSNKVVVRTPGHPVPPTKPGQPNVPGQPPRDPEDPRFEDSLIQPEKHNFNAKDELIDGKQVLAKATNHYVAEWDLDQYKGTEASKSAIQKGFAYVDVYTLDALTPLVDKFETVTRDGDKVEGLTMYHAQAGNLADLPTAVTTLLKDSGLLGYVSNVATGAFIWVADNATEFYNKYVSTGTDIFFNLPMEVKEGFSGKYENTTYQVDFGNGYKGNIVENFTPDLKPTKDVVVDGVSVDGKTVKKGQVFSYLLKGVVLPANRAENLFEYGWEDDYDQAGDKFLDSYVVKATTDIVVSNTVVLEADAVYSSDVTLSNGTVIKAGETVPKGTKLVITETIEKGSDLTDFTTIRHDKENGVIYIYFKESFLKTVLNSSEFGADVSVDMERIAYGTFENTARNKVNGVFYTTNTVTTDTPAPPAPPVPVVPPVVEVPGVPAKPATPEQPRLPETGDSESALALIGLVYAIGAVGMATGKKRKS